MKSFYFFIKNLKFYKLLNLELIVFVVLLTNFIPSYACDHHTCHHKSVCDEAIDNIKSHYRDFSKSEIDNVEQEIPSLKHLMKQIREPLSQKEQDEILADIQIQELKDPLRKLISRREYEIEKYWANSILAQKPGLNLLEIYPYYKRYQEFVALEFNTIKSIYDGELKKILFIGGGPLPLSSFLMAMDTNLEISIMDSNQEAYDIAKRLADHLEISENIRFIHEKAEVFQDYQDYDAIILASLVGEKEEEKIALLKHIKNRANNKVFLARSTKGLKTLVYPEINLGSLQKEGFNINCILHTGECLNNVIMVGKT